MKKDRNNGMSGCPENKNQNGHPTSSFRHWGHSQPPLSNQPSCGERRSGQYGPKQHDPMWLEARRLGMGREKDPTQEENLSIALCRARQLCDENRPTSTSRRRWKKKGRHHDCKGHLRRHVLRSWSSWVRMALSKIWKTLMAAQTLDTSTFQSCSRIQARKKIGMDEAAMPHEVLQPLPTLENERVRDAACAFRKRTSCADDHLVIEMLTIGPGHRENAGEVFPVQTAEPLDRGPRYFVDTTLGVLVFWHWIMTQTQCTHFRVIQDKMLRRMIHVPETPLKHLKHT